MSIQYEMIARIEHQARERVYRRALGDPEQAWLAEAELSRSMIQLDLHPVARALSAVVLAVLRIF